MDQKLCIPSWPGVFQSTTLFKFLYLSIFHIISSVYVVYISVVFFSLFLQLNPKVFSHWTTVLSRFLLFLHTKSAFIISEHSVRFAYIIGQVFWFISSVIFISTQSRFTFLLSFIYFDLYRIGWYSIFALRLRMTLFLFICYTYVAMST